MVTFGFFPAATSATYVFELRVNNTTAGLTTQQSPDMFVNEAVVLNTSLAMINLTVVANASTNPTTLCVANISGASRSIRNARQDTNGIDAYMTIFKLR